MMPRWRHDRTGSGRHRQAVRPTSPPSPRYLARASADLRQLERIVGRAAARSRPSPRPPRTEPLAPPSRRRISAEPTALPSRSPPPVPQPGPPALGGLDRQGSRRRGCRGHAVGVALLLVLAAQAGILRPECPGGRRCGAGRADWWASAWRLIDRPGGRVGAIALAATGIAAAYIDVIAVTTIYDWVPARGRAGDRGGGRRRGLTLARRWDSEHLGLLVLVPLIGLAPVVAGGVTLLLVGFMLALAAASLPVQLGRDWIGMHAARIGGDAPCRCSSRWSWRASTPSSRRGWRSPARWRHRRCAGIGRRPAPAAAAASHRAAMALLSAAGTAARAGRVAGRRRGPPPR